MSSMEETIKEADIRELKLMSGETLIGEIMGVHEKYLVVNEPYHVEFKNSGEAYFRRWFYSSDLEMAYIPEAHVITYAKCRYEIKRQYIKYCLEDHAIDAMEDDPDNYEFYADTPDESDIVH